jgi:hypothetical protein
LGKPSAAKATALEALLVAASVISVALPVTAGTEPLFWDLDCGAECPPHVPSTHRFTSLYATEGPDDNVTAACHPTCAG